MTDRQQLERLMAIVLQMREAQAAYFKSRKSASVEQIKALLTDTRMKADSLDNLIKLLLKQGYAPTKHEEAEQPKMF